MPHRSQCTHNKEGCKTPVKPKGLFLVLDETLQTVFGATSEKPAEVSRKSSDTAATHAICTESGKHVERCCSFGDYDSRKPNCESAQNVRGDMAGGDGGSGTMAAPVRVWRWVQASLPALSNAPESTVQTVLVKTFR